MDWTWFKVVFMFLGIGAGLAFLYGLCWLALGVFATLTRWIDEFVPKGLLRGCLWAIVIMGVWIGFLWVLSNLQNTQASNC